MPSDDKAGLKHAFARFRKPDEDEVAEIKLLGRAAGSSQEETVESAAELRNEERSYDGATSQVSSIGGLSPRPLLQREPERQLSFRCPVSLAAELQRKARYNQLEQQQILKEGLRRVLAELSDPPEGWVG